MNTESTKGNKKIIQAWLDTAHNDHIETLERGSSSDESQFQ